MHGAKSKRDGQGIWRDAKLIEKSMAGLGTRDTQLIYRFVLLLLLFGFLFFTDNYIPNFLLFFFGIDLFVLIGILTVLKLSRTLIDNDMGNRLRLVSKVIRVGTIRNYWWLFSSRVRLGKSEKKGRFFFDGMDITVKRMNGQCCICLCSTVY